MDQIIGWIKSALFILFFYYVFFSGGSTTGQALKHSMNLSRDYPHEVTTPRLGLKIYVNDYYIDMIKKNQNAVY
jgi:hypothetical protein